MRELHYFSCVFKNFGETLLKILVFKTDNFLQISFNLSKFIEIYFEYTIVGGENVKEKKELFNYSQF